MYASELQQLQPGKAYNVIQRHSTADRPQSIKVRRIFKGLENRFGSIPCAVFTARVGKDVSATFDAASKTLSMSGKRLPQQDVSIPHYDIASAELA